MKSVAEICDGLVQILDEQPHQTTSFVRAKLVAFRRACLLELPQARSQLLADLAEIINGEYHVNGIDPDCCHETWLRLRDFVLTWASRKKSRKQPDYQGMIQWMYGNQSNSVDDHKPGDLMTKQVEAAMQHGFVEMQRGDASKANSPEFRIMERKSETGRTYVKIICPRLLRGPLTLSCRGTVSFAY